MLIKRHLLYLVVSAISLLAGGCLWVADSIIHGPYATWYNNRCQELADRAKLIGRPESDVVKVLGPPTAVWKYWSGVWTSTGRPIPGAYLTTTYNYAPCPISPSGLFQVHCRDGVVRSTE